MKIVIHETYEYEVEADTAEEAVELWEEYMQKGSYHDDDIETGVSFNQNYVHTYDLEGNEV